MNLVELMPIDFGTVATFAAGIMGTMLAGIIGIFVLVAHLRMGVKWIQRAFSGSAAK